MKTIRKNPDALALALIGKILGISRSTVIRYLKSGKLQGQTIDDLCQYTFEMGKVTHLKRSNTLTYKKARE
jgi:predicted transcriptional regulator